MKKLLLCLMVLCTVWILNDGCKPAPLCSQVTAGVVTSYFDVPYYDPDGPGPIPSMKANIWVPDPQQFESPHPVMILIHGGCQNPNLDPGGGCRSSFGTEDNPQLGKFLAGRGYLAVAVQYRYPFNYFSGEGSSAEDDLASLPAPIQDVRCALRWIRSTSGFGFNEADDGRIIAHGGSGGGYFSLILASLNKVDLDTSPEGWDNPECSYNEPATMENGEGTASIQAVAAQAARTDNRPEFLDYSFPGIPPVYPEDWETTASELAYGNYWEDDLMESLDHFFGKTDFPSVYESDPDFAGLVDSVSLPLQARSDWPALFISHSVYDDLNYFEGIRALRSSLLNSGYPENELTLVPVARAECDGRFNSTKYCYGHDFNLFSDWNQQDSEPYSDRDGDGWVDYDPHYAFCSFVDFLEARFPPGRPIDPPPGY